MKHCFLCRWSFGATEFSECDKPVHVLKCWPEGYEDKEQAAKEPCPHYCAEDNNENINTRFSRWTK